MLLYYITDRRQFPGDERRQRESLLARIAAAARAGLEYIQLRERDLLTRELEALVREAVAIVHGASTGRTKLLVNSRTDVALAAGADGVHLRADDISASEARVVWHKACAGAIGGPHSRSKCGNLDAIIGVSCHRVAEVRYAEAHGADFAVFAPVFEKVTAPSQPGVGLETLRAACLGVGKAANVEGIEAGRMPVLALGGVTLANARACLEAGAAGIAAIRLFQEHDLEEIVDALREAAMRR